MEAYALLGKIYDALQGDEEETQWLEHLLELCDGILHEKKKSSLSILDLGAGTGIFALPLLKEGHFVEAVDLSETMLAQLVCKAKKIQKEEQLVVKKEDLAHWQGRGADKDLAFCFFDTLNHLAPEHVASFLSSVAASLAPKAYFLFDFLSLEYIQDHLDQAHYAEEFEKQAFFWKTDYLEEKQEILHQFSLYEQAEKEKLYTKEKADLREYYYPPETIDALLEKVGFEILSKDELGPEDRHVRLCRKK